MKKWKLYNKSQAHDYGSKIKTESCITKKLFVIFNSASYCSAECWTLEYYLSVNRYRGFAPQPCCMAGTKDSFFYGKNFFFLCKIFSLFLPWNMAAVQNLYFSKIRITWTFYVDFVAEDSQQVSRDEQCSAQPFFCKPFVWWRFRCLCRRFTCVDTFFCEVCRYCQKKSLVQVVNESGERNDTTPNK